MTYGERLTAYLGLTGQLTHNHSYHTLTFQKEPENSSWQGTIKEIGDDYAIIACQHLKQKHEMAVPFGLLVIVDEIEEGE